MLLLIQFTTNVVCVVNNPSPYWLFLEPSLSIGACLARELSQYSFRVSRVLVKRVQWSQAPVVQKVDNAIHRINLYSLDSAIGFPNAYPLDRDLSDE